MSLDWDVSGIASHDEVCFVADEEGRHLSAVTHGLIWATMAVDIGTITEENAAEFYARLAFFERVSGPVLTKSDGSSNPITPEDVQRHIGLRVNVTTLPRAKWLTKFKYDIDRDVSHFKRTVGAKAS